jgi:hypothetical protein
MSEPEHTCATCRRGLQTMGRLVCIVYSDEGTDYYRFCFCPDSRTCPEWEAQ